MHKTKLCGHYPKEHKFSKDSDKNYRRSRFLYEHQSLSKLVVQKFKTNYTIPEKICQKIPINTVRGVGFVCAVLCAMWRKLGAIHMFSAIGPI